MNKPTIFAIVCLIGMFSVPANGQQDNRRDERIRDYFQRREHLRRENRPPRHPPGPITVLRFRTIDGSQNNLVKTGWGKVENNLIRMSPVDYGDRLSSMAGQNRPSPRDISNIVIAQTEDRPNERQLTSMVWQWGQFVDHDIDLTHSAEPAEQQNITVPTGDPYFDPFETGVAYMDFYRSKYNSRSGISSPRQQSNSITAWIDGSQIYGSDEQTSRSLREFAGGRLRVSAGELLPIGDDGFFLAGDVRANEQLALTSMHTLFVREHNRVAAVIAANKPNLSDEQVYLRARREVVALLQSITYNEFLPALLGKNTIAPYSGYKPWISPKIANEFSTAAYRFGHSMLNSQLLRLDNEGREIASGNIALRDAFFNPQELVGTGIESYLKGLMFQQAQEIDAKLIDDVRNFLFGPPGSGGFDLASLNIQRGRDHGLPDYNSIRQAIGLPAVTAWEDISSDDDVQSSLAEAFESVDDIDAWVGMLSEDHVPGASVGPTVQRILKTQFERLRDADRFWYERYLNQNEILRIENLRLANIVYLNSQVRNIPWNVFFMPRHQP